MFDYIIERCMIIARTYYLGTQHISYKDTEAHNASHVVHYLIAVLETITMEDFRVFF